MVLCTSRSICAKHWFSSPTCSDRSSSYCPGSAISLAPEHSAQICERYASGTPARQSLRKCRQSSLPLLLVPICAMPTRFSVLSSEVIAASSSGSKLPFGRRRIVCIFPFRSSRYTSHLTRCSACCSSYISSSCLSRDLTVSFRSTFSSSIEWAETLMLEACVDAFAFSACRARKEDAREKDGRGEMSLP
jgi:hypothetical protein